MKKYIKSMTLNALILTLLILSSFIKIPIGTINFTLQILIIFIMTLILPLKDSLIIIGLYIFIGILGLPIFSMGGGIYYVYEPTFGYLIGFIFCVLVTKMITKI